MLFNSLAYFLFFSIVFCVYWFVLKKSVKAQNTFLLGSSFCFYGLWDWRFLFLLIFSIGLDYFSGLKIEKAQSNIHRKFWLFLSIGINLGFLGLFKYYNFFVSSFSDFLSIIGVKCSPGLLQVILPVGISFYTFHGLSYVIDIYNGKIKARKNLIDYSLFVSFFPLLVAGPIERADHLLPQIESPRQFDYRQGIDGLKQILWGLFKKIVIADNCSDIVDLIWQNPESYYGSTLLLGAVFFSFQIYGDFSGYSDIALGSARLLGFDLLKNFSFPYFSESISSFWKRWHISLSSWFRDYLYIPLGGSRNGKIIQIRNTFIIFILSGFWHGANWTFLVWGFLNALFIVKDIVFINSKWEVFNRPPNMVKYFKIFFTFILVSLLWIPFRAADLNAAMQYIQIIFSSSIFSLPQIRPSILIALILGFLIIEWNGRHGNHGLEIFLLNSKRLTRWSFFICLIIVILCFGGKPNAFIYFQF